MDSSGIEIANCVKRGKPLSTAVVVGSLNMDLVMRVPRQPHAGETMFGLGFAMAEGGKGANQAVAIARLGTRAAMVGRVGDDRFGAQLRDTLQRDGVDISHVHISAGTPTGVAMIMVDTTGENHIVLAPGANMVLGTQDIDGAAGLIGAARMMVMQMEVPVPTIVHAAGRARAAGVPVLLNPAPAAELPEDFWGAVDYLVPNETEASLLTGLHVDGPGSAAAAARVLRGRGVHHVLVTLGAQGVFIADDKGERLRPARRVAVVDTTAAGDSFIGGLVAGLCAGMTLDEAASLGIHTASLCVGRIGALSALPYLSDLSPA